MSTFNTTICIQLYLLLNFCCDFSLNTFVFFFFNDTAPIEIYTLSLHDALPISSARWPDCPGSPSARSSTPGCPRSRRSEEHTSELQSRQYLVCRLLLEKKK